MGQNKVKMKQKDPIEWKTCNENKLRIYIQARVFGSF